jgi:tetratricopeptide (TPR) repeat protein
VLAGVALSSGALAWAQADAPLAPRTFTGTLAVAEATGHDCMPLATPALGVEIATATPLADAALIGFEDGQVLRWRHSGGTLSHDGLTLALDEALAPGGAVVSLTAPGTETCRWTGTMRLAEASDATAPSRRQRLIDLDAANAVFAEAESLLARGKPGDALPLYQRVVDMRVGTLGAEHPVVVRAQVRVARALQLAGKPDAARTQVEALLAEQERLHGPDAIDTLRMRATLGMLEWAAGRPQHGLPLLRSAHEALRERLGPEHLATLSAQGDLGLLLWDLGRLPEAAAHLEFQLPRIVAIRGESHQRSLDAMNNLALIYQGLGRHAAALELFERGYRLSVAALGPDHPDTLTTLANVGDGYAQLDRIDDALSLYRVAHAGLQKALGDDHPWTMIAQSNIVASLLDLGSFEQATPLAVALVARAERVLGATHLHTLRWSGMLGGALYYAGDYAGAAQRYARLHAEQQRTLGADHPDTLESLANAAQNRYLAGDRARGLADLERAVAELRRVNGSSHRVTLTALAAFADVLAAEGRRDDAIRQFAELVDTVETLRADEGLARETRQAFFARWSIGYKRLALLHATRSADEAFRVAELSKARTLLESLALRSADMAGVVGAEDAARLAALEARTSELAHAIAQLGTRADEAFKLETERNALLRENVRLRRELRARHPRYAELSEVELIDARRAASLARRNEALVSYLVADDDVIAFVAHAGRPLRVRPLGRFPHLAASV